MKEKVKRRLYLHRPWLWGAAACAVVLLALAMAAAYHLGEAPGVLPPGSSAAGVDLGGLDRQAALERLEAEALPRYEAMEVEFVEGERAVASLTWRELGASPDLPGAVESLFSAIPQGDGWGARLERCWRKLCGTAPPREVPTVSLDPAVLSAALPSQPENARYDKVSGQVVEGRIGVAVDTDALEDALGSVEIGTPLRFQVAVREPEITAEELRTLLFRDILGTCTTAVTGSAARISNIRLSAAAIDGTVLNPGEIFDYNAVVGERTAEKGYGAAPAYVNGETVSEIGGGICQTSSTVYLAAVRADLAIAERVNHRYPSGYIPLGMDATVSWGGPEFRFQNDTAYPVRVGAAMEGDDLVVTISGTRLDHTWVEVNYEILSTTPYATEYQETDTLPVGKQQVQRAGVTGYTVQTYRNVYDSEGNLLRSAPEAKSVYQSRDAIVLVGTRRPETVEEPKKPPAGEKAVEPEHGESPEAIASEGEIVDDDPLPLRDLEQFR